MQGERPKRVAIILVLAVFLLGAAVGGLGTYLVRARITASASTHRPQPDHSPAALAAGRASRVEKMTKDLGLSPEQQKLLDSVLAQMQTQYAAAHEQSVAQMDQVRKQGRELIRAILTPDQAAKFDESLRKMDEERKKRNGN
jgi:ATP phosphoribosyltransferase regulatory subunit HisZ